MSTKTKSARGTPVDFELLRIKEQIASAPPPQDVQARQDFIDRKLRRRLKKATAVTPAPAVVPPVTSKPPQISTTPEAEEQVEDKKSTKAPAVKKTRQKARKK